MPFTIADATPTTRATGPNPLLPDFTALAEAGPGKALITVEPYVTEAEQKAVRTLIGLARRAGAELDPPRTVRVRTEVLKQGGKPAKIRVEFSLRDKIVHKPREESSDG